VLRRHHDWGQSTYLLIGDGRDFRCQDLCRAQVAADEGQPQPFVISRAKDVDPPAVFLDEDERVITAVEAAQVLTLVIELADGSAPTYRFEVGGFDMGRFDPPAAGAGE
jgi:hypothetical protein